VSTSRQQLEFAFVAKLPPVFAPALTHNVVHMCVFADLHCGCSVADGLTVLPHDPTHGNGFKCETYARRARRSSPAP